MQLHHTGSFLFKDRSQLFNYPLQLNFFSDGIILLLFIKQIFAAGIYRYDKRSQFFYADVPKSFRHTEVKPVHTGYFFGTKSSYDCIPGWEYTVYRSELAAGFCCTRSHAAFTYNESDTGLLYKIILKSLHPHRCSRSYGDHPVSAFSRSCNNRACMHEGLAAYFSRQIHTFTCDPYMNVVTPCDDVAVYKYDIACTQSTDVFI